MDTLILEVVTILRFVFLLMKYMLQILKILHLLVDELVDYDIDVLEHLFDYHRKRGDIILLSVNVHQLGVLTVHHVE